MFSMLVPLFVVLTALIGPSSAILLIPRIGRYQWANSIAYLGPADRLYPKVFNLVNDTSSGVTGDVLSLIAERDFNYTARSLYASGVLCTQIPVPDLFNPMLSRTLTTGFHLSAGDTGEFLSSSATIPTQLVTRVLQDQYMFIDPSSTYSALSYQPYVFVDCYNPRQCSKNGTYVHFDGTEPRLNEAIPLSSFYDEQNENRTVSRLYSDIDIKQANITTVWTSQANFSAVLATISRDKAPPQSSDFTDDLYPIRNGCPTACTIKAYWVKTLTTSLSNTMMVENGDPSSLFYGTSNSYLVNLSPAMLIHIDSIIRANLLLTEYESDFVVRDSFLQIVAPAIALMMSSSSTIPLEMRLNKTANNSGSEFWLSTTMTPVPDKDWLKQGGTTYSQAWSYFDTTNVKDRSSLGTVNMQAFYNNYRYNAEDTTVKLSLAVMFIYVIIVFTYLVYSFSTGYVGTSWHSVAEIVILALNSQRPDSFENTSVGIQTFDVFRRPVRLHVNENEACELVFSGHGTAAGTTFKGVEANRAY